MPFWIAGAASLGGGLISGLFGEAGASEQASAEKQAAQLAQEQYEQTRSDLLPYNTAGQSTLPAYTNYYNTAMPGITAATTAAGANIPQNVNNATIQNMPGYNFAMTEGLKAVQNAQTAQGLGLSGQAMKQGANFATGLANQYYQNYFGNAQTQYTDYAQQVQNAIAAANAGENYLQGPTQLGESAAAQTGTIGANLLNTQANAIVGAGQAQAAGTSGLGSAIGSGVSNAGNTAMNYYMFNQLMQNQNYNSGGP